MALFCEEMFLKPMQIGLTSHVPSADRNYMRNSPMQLVIKSTQGLAGLKQAPFLSDGKITQG